METPEPMRTRIITDEDAESITRVEELAYEIKIKEAMTSNPQTVESTMLMEDVLGVLRVTRISGVPVVDGSELMGVLSIEDVIRCLTAADQQAPVAKYMTRRVIQVREDDTIIEALKIFVNSGIGRLPVLDQNGKLSGIITKGDVTRGLLKALQRDYQVEEVRKYRARHLFEDIESDRTSLILRYNIQPHDFTKGGAASSKIKRALVRLGASPQLARRCGIAIYEAEMNLIIHTTNGGFIRVEIEPHQINIVVADDGPGIPDIELAMKPGYSTASEEIRELGFGAGMGLVNISRCVDYMKLDSAPRVGTRLRMKIYLNKEQTVGEGYLAKESTQ